MPTYEHEGIIIRFPEEAAGLSVSGLLCNKGIFHVKVSPNAQGEVFAFLSPAYSIRLTISDNTVTFQRNSHVAAKQVGPVRRYYQILVSWKPDQIQVALMVDDNVGGDDACVSVATEPIYVPLELLEWARRFSLLPRTAYASPAEFLGVFIESFRQAHSSIRDTNSYRLFWDRQHSKDNGPRLVPKREPEAMAGVAGFLHDQSLVAGYQLVQESAAGPGTLDLRASAALRFGGMVTVCVEGKNAHSDDLEHGITDQLPAYMKAVNADYGVYLVLWYQCEEFNYPKESDVDVTWSLTKKRPWETIVVEKFDLALPKPPSHRDFSFA
jgi:hypothetical protein